MDKRIVITAILCSFQTGYLELLEFESAFCCVVILLPSVVFCDFVVQLHFLLDQASQPKPSPSPSNPCGSVEGTLKFLCFISPQSKSGGLGCIQTSG